MRMRIFGTLKVSNRTTHRNAYRDGGICNHYNIARSATLLLIVLMLLCVCSSLALATIIDFENIASGTVIREQFTNQGLLVSGEGGLVYSEGTYGVANFGNSSTQILDIGDRGRHTQFTFVDPNNISSTIGASYVSMLIGDGDTAEETFTVWFLSISGDVLDTQTYTTATQGAFVQASSAALGAPIGSVRVGLFVYSSTGAVMDDLQYTLASVPEPSSILTLLCGISGMGGVIWRRKSA